MGAQIMIENFSDHASNERTMLAWVRTGVALIAFGFVLEKFHLFLKAFHDPASGSPNFVVNHDPKAGSIFMIVLGLTTIGFSVCRYLQTAKSINDPQKHQYSSIPTVVASSMFFALGLLVLFYVIDIT